MSTTPAPPDRAEPTLTEPETMPPLGPSNLVSTAIEQARALLTQMAPQTPEEAAAHDRAMTGLDKLQHHLERIRHPQERTSSAALALAINLSGHQDPQQAHETHLVLPLVIAASTIASMRTVKPWIGEWLSTANTAVCADLASQRAERRGEES